MRKPLTKDEKLYIDIVIFRMGIYFLTFMDISHYTRYKVHTVHCALCRVHFAVRICMQHTVHDTLAGIDWYAVCKEYTV